jgi:hypothetical protein
LLSSARRAASSAPTLTAACRSGNTHRNEWHLLSAYDAEHLLRLIEYAKGGGASTELEPGITLQSSGLDKECVFLQHLSLVLHMHSHTASLLPVNTHVCVHACTHTK